VRRRLLFEASNDRARIWRIACFSFVQGIRGACDKDEHEVDDSVQCPAVVGNFAVRPNKSYAEPNAARRALRMRGRTAIVILSLTNIVWCVMGGRSLCMPV
jgi:hypothetical protein